MDRRRGVIYRCIILLHLSGATKLSCTATAALVSSLATAERILLEPTPDLLSKLKKCLVSELDTGSGGMSNLFSGKLDTD